MGWWDSWDTVKEWGEQAWSNASLSNIVMGTARFSYKTTEYLFSQVSVLPKLAYSMVFHQKTRDVTGHLVRVAVQDILPMVIVSYVNDSIQRKGREYLGEQPDEAWLSVDTLIQSSLLLLNTASWIYTKRRKMQALVRTTTLILETPLALSDKIPVMKICEEEKCTTLRFLKGSFRDLISYYGTELLIELVGYVPVVGQSTSWVLSIYHHGRYVTTLVLPICSRHQEYYINEHLEFVVSQGIAYAGTTTLANCLIEKMTGIPRLYYESAIQQLLLVGQVGIAAHSKLPRPVKNAERRLADPLALYVTGINNSVDFIIEFAKKKLPSLLNRPQLPTINWANAPDILFTIWTNRGVEIVKGVLLPRLLQNSQNLIDDPLIGYHWPGLKKRLIASIENASDVSEKYAIKVAVMIPNATTETVWVVMGTPRVLTRLILKILGNKEFMAMLAEQRRTLEGMHSGPKPTVIVKAYEPSVRGQEQSTPIISKISLLEEDSLKDKKVLTPEPIVTKAIDEPETGKLSSIEAKLETRKALSSFSIKNDTQSPGTKLIKKEKARFFKEGSGLNEDNLFSPSSGNNLKRLSQQGEMFQIHETADDFGIQKIDYF